MKSLGRDLSRSELLFHEIISTSLQYKLYAVVAFLDIVGPFSNQRHHELEIRIRLLLEQWYQVILDARSEIMIV